MKQPQTPEGKIIADLHTHPADYLDKDETLEALCSPGLVGLTHMNGNPRVLIYEKVLKGYSNAVKEIDRNQLAQIKNGNNIGYIARTQEIDCGLHHILAVGFEGDYLPDYKDARKAVEEIHKKQGIAILNHPYVTPQPKFVKYRYITSEEEIKVEELCEMIDEIEVFNAQSINPTLGIYVPNMKKSNDQAKKVASKYKFTGTAASDTHRALEQLKIAGIYIPKENLSIERIKDDVPSGNFEAYEQYVSRWSFLRGMFFLKSK